MKIRKFEKEDILQVLELCREVRNHHREFLGGYFAEQDDEKEKVGFMQSLESDKIIFLVVVVVFVFFVFFFAESFFFFFFENLML